MPYRRTFEEALHILTIVVVTAAMFGAAAWTYPQGFATIWNIGFVTMAAVGGMNIPELRRAWMLDRNKQGNRRG